MDTDVLVAAFRSNTGASRRLLEAARVRRFRLLSSVPLILEYESVLTRPERRATTKMYLPVLDELALLGERVELAVRLRPMLVDQNDEMVLETAINGRADAIITFNERDFKRVTERFRCAVPRLVEAVHQLARERLRREEPNQ